MWCIPYCSVLYRAVSCRAMGTMWSNVDLSTIRETHSHVVDLFCFMSMFLMVDYMYIVARIQTIQENIGWNL